ncbi:MAG: hypothetical protein K0R15_289 [Clostridiales bacterium]|jgi:hypothetical protein|nr:hypothetical protein [Clostridiales bacterium]
MIIEEFKLILMNEIKEYLPESYKEANISFNKTLKNNNIELDTIVIANNKQQIIPNIYLNTYLFEINEGRAIDEILKDIARLYLDGTRDNTFEEFDTEFDKIKNQIVVRMVGKENNQKLMERAPFREENDLLVTYRWIAKKDENGLGSILITNTLLEKWKKEREIDSNDFYEMALKNTERLFPAYVTSMEDLLLGLIPDMIEFEEFVPHKKSDTIPMYVITNKDKMNGATTILYPGILEKMADKLNGNYFILPSSIHEVIVVADDEKVDKEQLKCMVKQVNSDMVEAEEILSNSVYTYDRDKKEIKKV